MNHRTVALLALTLAACTDPDDDPTLADRLLGSTTDPDFDTLLPTCCPAIDRAAGIPGYRGLAGTYQRLDLPAPTEPYRLTFFTVADDPDAAGTFTGLRRAPSGFLAPYAGAFRAIPDNAAIGAALALDTNVDGALDQTFFVLGVRRAVTAPARVTALCLAGATRPFQLNRMFY